VDEFRRLADLLDKGATLTEALRIVSGVRWDDLKFPFVKSVQGNTDTPDFDYDDLGLLFPQNDTGEIAYAIAQFPHAWKQGSEIRPHIHYIQDESETPVYKMDYRVYNNGSTVPAAFTTISTADGDGPVFTWTSGELLQIQGFPAIDMTGYNLSCIMDIKVYRDDNVVTGDVLTKEFDIHYQSDGDGSRQEYTK